MAVNPTLNAPMADVRDMYMAHAAFRREFRLLPQLIRSVAWGDTARAEVVGAHAELVCRVLHTHHEGEDLLLWPTLLHRGGEEAAAIVPTMEKQHQAIDQAHAEAVGLLPAWRSTGHRGQELADAFELLLDLLLEHMATEEEQVLPLAQSSRRCSPTHRCPSACSCPSSAAAAMPPTPNASTARPPPPAWAPFHESDPSHRLSTRSAPSAAVTATLRPPLPQKARRPPRSGHGRTFTEEEPRARQPASTR
jgi:hemerythrin-like domain-containing protein